MLCKPLLGVIRARPALSPQVRDVAPTGFPDVERGGPLEPFRFGPCKGLLGSLEVVENALAVGLSVIIGGG